MIDTKPLEEVLFYAQEEKCFYCDKKIILVPALHDKINGYTVDHFFPRHLNKTQTGKKRKSDRARRLNSVLCHYNCNQIKGSRSPTEHELEKFLHLWSKLDKKLTPTTYCSKKLLPKWKEIVNRIKNGPMTLVVIESPYAGNIEENVKYTRKCMRDCLERGESPFASHLLYTQAGILDDNLPGERQLGIDAGLEWGKHAKKTVVYFDKGISKGMIHGIKNAADNNRIIECRSLYGTPVPQQLIDIINLAKAIKEIKDADTNT